MMKKIYKMKIGALLIGAGLLVGCNDFFDVAPTNGVETSKYYNNVNDINGGALGIYGALAPEVHRLFLWGSARADMVIAGEGKDAYITEFINNQVTALNPYTNYAFLYKAIARCNHHLEHISRVKPSDVITPSKLEPFYGEAYFLRAWCYFQLVRTFENFPLLTDDISEEITLVNEAGDTTWLKTMELSDEQLRAIALQPAAKQDVWKQIISDVNKALRLIKDDRFNQYDPPFGLNTDQKVDRISLKAAYTLACEVALWNRQFTEASEFANYVLNYNPTAGAAATWSSQYTQNGVAAAYNAWSFIYNYTGAFETTRMQEFTSPVEGDGGRYLVKPNVEILDSIFDETNDIRRKSSWMRVDRKDVIWKYIGLDEEGKAMREPYQSIAPFHLYKIADAFLFKGIAEIQKGNTGAALEMLNAIRQSRGLLKYEKNTVPMTKEFLEGMLFRERARESAFEGQRWYDLLLQEEVLGKQGVIAATVSRKYPKEQRAEAYNRLLNRSAWYLPIEPERWK